MGETFYLDIVENDILTSYNIDEPFGYDVIAFKLAQAENGLSRDNTIAGSEIDLEFTDMRNHHLEKILYMDDKYGFEADISLRIIAGSEILAMQFDLQDSITDGITYFKCRLLQTTQYQILKRRRDVKVNLFSDKDLDGIPITPLVPENILLKAKPVVQISKWESQSVNQNWQALGSDALVIAPFTNLTQSDIDDSYSPFIQVNQIDWDSSQGYIEQIREEITLLEATSNLSNITVNIKGVNLAVATSGFYTRTEINLNYGLSYSTTGSQPYTSITLFSSTNNNINLVNQSYSIAIPFIPNTGKLWINIVVSSGRTFGGGTPVSNSVITFSAPDDALTIEATSTVYNTVTPTFRLGDVMKYVVKSISGLDSYLPRFASGGYLYDQRLLNGNFLRQKTDQPFYITLKQIEEGIKEFRADHEIQTDDKVFFGIYDDYYQDDEIAFFSQAQFDSFKKTKNTRYSINRFSFGYKHYESLKENTTENTVDSVHGESEWLLANRHVEKHEEVKVEFIRDSFFIGNMQRKAITESQSTATQDDDKIAIIDTYPTLPSTLNFAETSFLQHKKVGTTLILKNTGEFSWIQLGITTGQFFVITAGQNIGNFTVVGISMQSITLLGPSTFEGEVITSYTYYIDATLLVGVNWTSQDITTANIANGDNFANLRFSIRRNIENYHSKFLATANLYKASFDINNTFYKNNPDAVITYAGQTIREGDPIMPTDPILTPVLYEDCIFIMEFADFIALQNNIRTRRGFVRFIDNEGFVRKMFIWEMEYSPFEERLTITKGEEKFEPVIINIITNPDGTKTINNEYTVWELTHEIVGDKVRIMDNRGELLYNPLFYHRIAVNGSVPSSMQELSEWLLLL